MSVVVDSFSADYLRGSKVDFVDNSQEADSRSITRTPAIHLLLRARGEKQVLSPRLLYAALKLTRPLALPEHLLT